MTICTPAFPIDGKPVRHRTTAADNPPLPPPPRVLTRPVALIPSHMAARRLLKPLLGNSHGGGVQIGAHIQNAQSPKIMNPRAWNGRQEVGYGRREFFKILTNLRARLGPQVWPICGPNTSFKLAQFFPRRLFGEGLKSKGRFRCVCSQELDCTASPLLITPARVCLLCAHPASLPTPGEGGGALMSPHRGRAPALPSQGRACTRWSRS